MKNRKLTSVLAGVMLAAVLMTGCSDKGLDGSQVAATVGGEEISLGLANFTARIQQAQAETYYKAYFGDSMWSQDIGGMTYEESVKDSIMDMLKEYYIVRAHASEYGVALSEEEEQKIADAAAKFMSDNPEKTITQMTASEEVVRELLELITIRSHVYNEVIKGEYIGCHPCINTSSIRFKTSDFIEKIIPALNHEPVFIDLMTE